MEPTLILLIKICAHSFPKVGVAIRGSLDSCDPTLCLPNLQFYMKEFLLSSLCMQGRAGQKDVLVGGGEFISLYWWSLMACLSSLSSRPKLLYEDRFCSFACSLLHKQVIFGIHELFIMQNFGHIQKQTHYVMKLDILPSLSFHMINSWPVLFHLYP